MTFSRITILLFTVSFLSSCETKMVDQAPRLEQIVSIISSTLKTKDPSSTSSHSTKHAEYNETSVVDLPFDTQDNAIKLSNLIKENLEKSGCRILMFNSFATVRSSDKDGWSGQIDSIKDQNFVGGSYSMSSETASGEMVSEEKFYMSCIVDYEQSTILLHCSVFPEAHRIHSTATIIK